MPVMRWPCNHGQVKASSLTSEELKDLWQYLYSLRGYTVNIESAKRGEAIFNRIDTELRGQVESNRIKAVEEAMLSGKENSKCSTQEREEQ